MLFRSSYKSINDVFEISLAQEKEVTQSINKLVEITFTSKDYASFNFLQWYVAEQHEEEMLFTSILDIIRITGAEGRGLLLIDNEIAKLRKEDEKD